MGGREEEKNDSEIASFHAFVAAEIINEKSLIHGEYISCRKLRKNHPS